MKTRTFNYIGALALLCTFGSADIVAKKYAKKKIVGVQSIQNIKDALSLAKYFDGQHAVEFPAGTVIEGNAKIDGEFFAFEENPSFRLKILKPFYARVKNNKTLISEDGKKWEPLEEFFEGNIGFDFTASNGTQQVRLYGSANKRK